MDEVLHNLWVGDLSGALDTEKLRAQKIRSVLTASRGRLSVHLVRPHTDAYQVRCGWLTDA